MPVAQNEVEVQHELLTRIADARTQTDRLFEIVKPEALYDRPIPERHRIVFYIGHLEAFDRNLLRERVLGLNTPHPDLDDLFAFGIDPVGGHEREVALDPSPVGEFVALAVGAERPVGDAADVELVCARE